MYWKAEKGLGRHKLTSMTLDQIRALQQKMVPYGSSASGRYQFIRGTFDATRKAMGLPGDAIWSPAVQDNMALNRLNKRGLTKYLAGEISREDFANNLAKEWASLPVVTHIQGATRMLEPGQSYYAGDGLNKSLHTPQEILHAIDAIQGQPVVIAEPESEPEPEPEPEPELAERPVVDPGVQRIAFTALGIVIVICIVIAIYYMWN